MAIAIGNQDILDYRYSTPRSQGSALGYPKDPG